MVDLRALINEFFFVLLLMRPGMQLVPNLWNLKLIVMKIILVVV